jgi:hypothetical protein
MTDDKNTRAVHADFPAIALANISRDDIAFFEEHRLGGMHFLHHAPFRDRTDTVADCVGRRLPRGGVCSTSRFLY